MNEDVMCMVIEIAELPVVERRTVGAADMQGAEVGIAAVGASGEPRNRSHKNNLIN